MLRRQFLALALLAACKRRAPSASVARVVSLSPSTTEAVCALGARALLVGRSRYCDYPADVRALPEVGGYLDPNLEAILALSPDLVTSTHEPPGATIKGALAERGIATYFAKTETLADVDAMIRGLGERLARAKEAAEVVDGIHADEAKLARDLAGKPAPRVLFVVGLAPVVAVGPGTFADELLALARGVNVITEGQGYPTLGMEKVLALDPDVVLESSEHGHTIAPSTPWGKLRAVTSGRVAHLKDESALRPGPRVARGAEAIARAIHGF